jgi:hypothetical protein
MVYYSKIAQNDLVEIFWGLLTWDKHPLEYEHVYRCLDDLRDVCSKPDQMCFHSRVQTINLKKGKFQLELNRV